MTTKKELIKEIKKMPLHQQPKWNTEKARKETLLAFLDAAHKCRAKNPMNEINRIYNKLKIK